MHAIKDAVQRVIVAPQHILRIAALFPLASLAHADVVVEAEAVELVLLDQAGDGVLYIAGHLGFG